MKNRTSRVPVNGSGPVTEQQSGSTQEGKNTTQAPVDSANLADLGFWDQLHSLGDSQWQFHVVYLYRTDPPIRNGNDKNFIAKLTRPFDEADVLATHGSGKYLAILNNSRERRTVGKISFSCYHPDAPPKIRLAQLAPNADESWRTWLEDIESKRAQTATVNSQSESDRVESDPATSEAIRQMGELSKQILARDAQTQRAGKETGPVLDSTLATLLTQMASGRDQLAEKLAEKTNNSSQTDPIVLLEKAASVLARLQPTAQQPAQVADPVEQVRKTVEVVTLLRDTFSNGAGETHVLETLMTSLPGILQSSSNLIGTVINGVAMARAATVGPPGGAPVLAPRPSTGTPGITAATAAPVDNGQQPVGTESNPSTEGTQPLPLSSELLQLAQFAMDALHRGIDGASFADGLFLTRGALYLDTIQRMGAEGIMTSLSAVPQLQQILPQVQSWVEDFCSYDPNEPEPEEENERDAGKKAPTKEPSTKRKEKTAPVP